MSPVPPGPDPLHRSRRRSRAALTGLLLLLPGCWLLARDVYLRAKAWAATRCIEAAFERHLADGEAHPPWAWADTYPVARLEVPRLGVRRLVLQGAQGPSLAFGPGHVAGTAPPNASRTSVIAGHRDSWFAFLRDLRPGDLVRVSTRGGTRRWTVRDARVVAETDAAVLAPSSTDRLTLLTCWPFDGLAGSPWRWAVTLDPT